MKPPEISTFFENMSYMDFFYVPDEETFNHLAWAYTSTATRSYYDGVGIYYIKSCNTGSLGIIRSVVKMEAHNVQNLLKFCETIKNLEHKD